MKCHLCELKARTKCDNCMKPTCIYHLVKGYLNRKSEGIKVKLCYKCLDKTKGVKIK